MESRRDAHDGDRPAPAVDAATVALVRDAPATADGMEVLLLRRHAASRAFAGAHVFPGGKVDDHDRRLDAGSWVCADLAVRRGELGAGTEAAALGFLVAAVRETFEEAGVLLAHRRDGSPLTAADLDHPSFVAARERLAALGRRWDWSPWLREEGLVLDLDALELWSWWVTPVHRQHRFDTRVFLAASPAAQTARHDAVETTAMRWMAPTTAIEEHEEGGIELRAATRWSLDVLRRYRSLEDAVAAARRGEVERRRIQGLVRWEGDELRTELAIGAPLQTELPPR